LQGTYAGNPLTNIQEPLDLTFYLRPRTTSFPAGFKERPEGIQRSESQEWFSAEPADVEAVLRFAKRSGLVFTGSFLGGRSLTFRGAVPDIENAFGTCLRQRAFRSAKFRTPDSVTFLPPGISPMVEAVFGLDNRIVSEPLHLRRGIEHQASALSSIEEIACRYRFPQNLSGRGECIGILSFGGGISDADLTRFFLREAGSVPELRFVNIAPASQPNIDSQHDRELALDIELAGSLAPGARIVTYSAPNDERGWAAALFRAIYDWENCPSVLSISWGAAEDCWGTQTIGFLNRILQEAARLGITVCAASGDDGCARDMNGHCRVTFPASSPFVLACGGTLPGPGGSETVWNVRNHAASGGGISDCIPRPPWQSFLPAAASYRTKLRRDPCFDGRLLPDVSGPAGPWYSVYAGGTYQNGTGGTSAAAPLWSALIARLNEGLRARGLTRIGHFHPRLYLDPSIQRSFQSVTSGQNDPFGLNGYQANPGWNPCTGWGTPDGERLFEVLLGAGRNV
jgi:kumamolisin